MEEGASGAAVISENLQILTVNRERDRTALKYLKKSQTMSASKQKIFSFKYPFKALSI